VTPDGKRYGGAGAINLAVSVALGTPLPMRVYSVPGVRRLQEASYRWVARNRRRLPGETPYCKRLPAECGWRVAEGPAAP